VARNMILTPEKKGLSGVSIASGFRDYFVTIGDISSLRISSPVVRLYLLRIKMRE